MKNLIPLSCLLISLCWCSACKKEQNGTGFGDFFWAPALTTSRSHQGVELKLTDPRPYTDYFQQPRDPDLIEVYQGTKLDDLQLAKRVDGTDEIVSFKELDNDTPYYWQIITSKKGFGAIPSQRLMTIPGISPEAVRIFPQNDAEMEQLAFSYSNTYFSYFDKEGQLFHQKIGDPIAFGIIGKQFEASWSPIKEELAFFNVIREENIYHTTELVILDVNTIQKKTIPFDRKDIYYTDLLGYSPSGEKLLFKGNPEEPKPSISELYLIDIATATITQHSAFESMNFRMTGSTFIDEQSIYLSGYTGSSSNGITIYHYDLMSQMLTPLIITEWRDMNPVLSPNKETLAFFSDRSGNIELWTYNLADEKFAQITDNNISLTNIFSSTINWENDQSILVTAHLDNKTRGIRLVLK